MFESISLLTRANAKLTGHGHSIAQERRKRPEYASLVFLPFEEMHPQRTALATPALIENGNIGKMIKLT